MGRAVSIALLGLVSLACHNERPREPRSARVSPPDDSGRGTGSAVVARRHGVGHNANIDLVALASDGCCAVTRDSTGAVRLWTALDGSVEPQPIAAPGATSLSVAVSGDAHVVTAVQPSGGLAIFRVGADGKSSQTGEIAPHDPLFEAHVLYGGQRVVALFRDHTVRLLDAAGRELARHAERSFRPTQLRLSADGATIAALIVTRRDPEAFEGEAQRLALVAGDKPTIEPIGSPVLFSSDLEPNAMTTALSPDLSRLATLRKDPKPEDAAQPWRVVVHDLASDGSPRRHPVPLPAAVRPSVGFVDGGNVLIATTNGRESWLLSLDSGDVRGRSAPPESFHGTPRAEAHAGGVQALGHGSWLFVHDVNRRAHRFLGYEPFQPQSVALSPDGELVAWGYGQGHALVVPTDGSRTGEVALRVDDAFGVSALQFIDREHVLAADGFGGLHLFHWPTATRVAEAGVNGSVRGMQWEPQTSLLLVERHTGDARVFEVDVRDGFAGPYLIVDGSHQRRLLAPGALGLPGAALWTLGSANTVRTYDLDELRGDMGRAQVLGRGEVLAAGTPMHVDRHGRHYELGWRDGLPLVTVRQGEDAREVAVTTGSVSAVVPSWNGDRFLAVHRDGGAVADAVYSLDSSEPVWSYSTGVANSSVVWSRDDRYIAIASNGGGVVLDATTGRPVVRRCGIEFRARGAAPATAFNNPGVATVCE